MNIRPIKCEKCGKNLSLFEGNICLECEEKAIQAVEQEPCSDAISRQAVIKKLIEQSAQVYIDETDFQRGYIDGVIQVVKELKVERQKSIQEHADKVLEDIKAEIEDLDTDFDFIGFYKCQSEVLKIIDKHIGENELKTGHWIGDNQAFYIYAKCSECGSVHDTATNYCPDCGCLMDRTEFDEYVKTEGV